jgi:hypothetical protein
MGTPCIARFTFVWTGWTGHMTDDQGVLALLIGIVRTSGKVAFFIQVALHAPTKDDLTFNFDLAAYAN